ncbi:hypothetical protein SAMN04488109_0599 [Chryseolinea serpens]|uniref:Uncharacterized protein n=1 Tax=Chryseolinea serpens TaxID=947013 RepID=A0A1M5KGC2_9BACT|nr:hypothetical protein [Chryseolinea serpens]SHG51223.1 hypothetical protein SAMN04488109_0599 [Chryseolinea serpens]
MDQELKTVRRKLNNALEPVKVMMMHQKRKMVREEWLSFVERTKTSVVNHPYEYINNELGSENDLVPLVTKIFDDFLSENP